MANLIVDAIRSNGQIACMNEDQKTLAQLALVYNRGSSDHAVARALQLLIANYYQDLDWYRVGRCVVVRSYAERREIHDGLNEFYNYLENEQSKNDISHAVN